MSAMGIVRLGILPQTFIALSYGLPLLLCIWHQDKRLLWTMALTFLAMASYQAFRLVPADEATQGERLAYLLTQAVNLVVVAATVNAIINLTRRLARHTAELRSQAGDLQRAFTVAERRERLLQSLIDSLQEADDGAGGPLPATICQPLISLFEGRASGAVVAEKRDGRFAVLAHVNMEEYAQRQDPDPNTFADIVMAEGRTEFVEDLRRREDIDVIPTGERTFRSVLATPLRFGGEIVGVVEVMSGEPRRWTPEEFKVIEWVSAQCTLVMETRRLRHELLRANSRLDSEVRERTSELQDFVNELEHFSYTITHDLRAPLRAMQGFAALLDERHGAALDGEGKDYLERISTAAARMDRLITDALSYSRIVRQELPVAPVDLRALLAGMLHSYPSLQAIEARIDIDADLPSVLANDAGLTQLFSNLLGNAVKFVPPGRVPHVRIHGERDGRCVRICVEDNGIGIAPEHRERVFGMFQRLSKDYEGTGIGLALVRKIAERMGGSVSLESTPGEGCRFWVTLRAPAEVP